jgi:hypothetical protein
MLRLWWPWLRCVTRSTMTRGLRLEQLLWGLGTCDGCQWQVWIYKPVMVVGGMFGVTHPAPQLHATSVTVLFTYLWTM